MQIKIQHQTHIQFSKTLQLTPHIFRYMPFRLSHYTLEDFHLDIHPVPAGLSTKKDIVNNTVSIAWFEKPTNELRVNMEVKANIKPFDPHDFVVYPEDFLSLNFHYSRKRWPLLIPYLETPSMSREFKKYTIPIAEETKQQTLPFIEALIKDISKNFKVHYKSRKINCDPLATLETKTGTPVEIAWMTVQMMRVNGIAARITSGYYVTNSDQLQERYAWVQIYLPGPGWLGLDPINGWFTDHNYIPVSAAPYLENIDACFGEPRADVETVMTDKIKIERL